MQATSSKSYIGQSFQHPTPDPSQYTVAIDAVYANCAPKPNRSGKRTLLDLPAGYSASYTLHPGCYVQTARPDGTQHEGGFFPLASLPVGVLTRCPIIATRARHRVGYTVGRKGGLAEGVLCPGCKHIHYFTSLAPFPYPAPQKSIIAKLV
ncbi:hypothetical protein X979_3070 [Burkholderia pseudomallei MSHR7527]|nr:hypothetical protein X979_3070 [Burkholderia pseudomallei MSHR7527]CAJ8620327.1 Uncharacterised protein [Burkholderia pseudomallei]CAK0114033.1 Uncharacterised protein [Burkholderia pseudomallei]